MTKKDIWIIGAGEMAIEYVKVLKKLKLDFLVIGRGKKNVEYIQNKYLCDAVSGGLDNYISNCSYIPKKVIIAVGIENLKNITIKTILFGVKDILLEKPGVGYAREIYELCDCAKINDSNILLAYNRRFYASVIKLKELIDDDGGIKSFNFEFTEWSHIVGKLKKHPTELENWFLGNSTHVIDTAFYVAGEIKDFSHFYTGSNVLKWHKNPTIFAGAGVTVEGALFSYQANWQSPGRWGLEFLTKNYRYILRPMEKLYFQKIGSVAIEEYQPINYEMDEMFKPGIFLQTKSFIENDTNDFISIHQQREKIEFYKKISGYKN